MAVFNVSLSLIYEQDKARVSVICEGCWLDFAIEKETFLGTSSISEDGLVEIEMDETTLVYSEQL